MNCVDHTDTDIADVGYRWLGSERLRQRARVGSSLDTSAYTLLLVGEGSGRAVLERTEASLARGGCLLLAPGSSCVLETGDEELAGHLLRFAVVGFGGEGEGEEQAPTFLLGRRARAVCLPGAAAALEQQAEQLLLRRDDADELERLDGQIRFQTLLLTLLKALRAAEDESEPGRRQAVADSIRYVREHFEEPLAIEGLAARAGIGRGRYTQLFKEATGRLPIDYLNELRIEKAQQLLLMTGDRLQNIAQTVGFNNEYYFNRRFKQRIGLAPGQYRSRYRTMSRVFAPFLEDHLLALGIRPIMQCAHRLWGRQDYLNLRDVPDFDITTGDWEALSRLRPEFAILDEGSQRWSLDRCSEYAPVFKLPYIAEEWRLALRGLGAALGREREAEEAIASLERRAEEAKRRLGRTARRESVAVLRISARSAVLYGSAAGYTGPLLYRGLGLTEPAAVRRFVRQGRRATLTAEQLAELDADHLFVAFDPSDGDGRELLDRLAWQRLPAVRGGRVYEVDFMAWMNYGVLSHGVKIDDVLRVLGG